MNGETKVFKRNYLSHIDLSIICMLAALFGLAIELFILKKYLLVLVVLLLLVLMIDRYLRLAKQITVNSIGFQGGNTSVNWDNVDRIKFTVSPGRDYWDTVIVVEAQSGIHTIHTKYYQNSKELRDLFQNICNEKSINYVVEDRGLY